MSMDTELERECMALRAERDALAARLAIAQGMADTMAMLRSEMIDAGVIDASVAPMFFPESIIPRLLKLAELEGQTDNLLSTCHRLALELECLLLDTKDLAPVSRWWDSAMVALDEWHKAKDSVSARPIPAEPVNARLLDVAVWPAGYCRDPNGKMSIPAGKEEDFNFGYDVGFQEAWEILNSAISAAGKSPTSQQERLLQDMHDAGREVDRVMAEAAPKAVRLTHADIAKALASAGLKPEDYREDGEILPLVIAIESAALRKNGIEVAE